MKWVTTEAMLEQAKKFAEEQDDLAVKADEHGDYEWHKGMADLFRAMSKEIKRLDELEALS